MKLEKKEARNVFKLSVGEHNQNKKDKAIQNTTTKNLPVEKSLNEEMTEVRNDRLHNKIKIIISRKIFKLCVGELNQNM